MDEVICPHCGKANLAADRFCHHCLKPLRPLPSDKVNEPQAHEDVPEWLKHIRELKRADEEREKEKEKWRQQTLFGQNGETQKGKDSPAGKMNTAPQSGVEKKQPALKQPPASRPTADSEQKSGHSPNQAAIHTKPGDDKSLPEGFLPLSIDDD